MTDNRFTWEGLPVSRMEKILPLQEDRNRRIQHWLDNPHSRYCYPYPSRWRQLLCEVGWHTWVRKTTIILPLPGSPPGSPSRKTRDCRYCRKTRRGWGWFS